MWEGKKKECNQQERIENNEDDMKLKRELKKKNQKKKKERKKENTMNKNETKFSHKWMCIYTRVWVCVCVSK